MLVCVWAYLFGYSDEVNYWYRYLYIYFVSKYINIICLCLNYLLFFCDILLFRWNLMMMNVVDLNEVGCSFTVLQHMYTAECN